LYYTCRGAVRCFQYAGKKDSALFSLPKRLSAGIPDYVSDIVVNENRSHMIICYSKQNSHDLYNITKIQEASPLPNKGGYVVPLNKCYASFDRGTATVSLRKYDGSVIRSITLNERPERMVNGPLAGSVVFGTKEEAIIFDIDNQKVLKVIKMKSLKRVVSGGPSGQYGALIGKRQVNNYS